MVRRKNTLMDNENADQFFSKSKPGLMGDGFIGLHEETKRDMKKQKPRKLFLSVENFIEG